MTPTIVGERAGASPLAYLGGKSRLAPRIRGLLGVRPIYVDPFCGGLSVPLGMAPSVQLVLGDVDVRLMAWWKAVRDAADELIHAIKDTPVPRTKSAWVCMAEELNPMARWDVRDIAWWWVLRHTSFGGAGRSWNHDDRPAPISPEALDRIAAASMRLRGADLSAQDWTTTLGGVTEPERTAIYLDPPYEVSTRLRPSTTGAGTYDVELPDADHAPLLQCARALADAGANVVVSHYPSPLYATALHDWASVAITVTSSVGCRDGAPQSPRTEILWASDPTTWQLQLVTTT